MNLTVLFLNKRFRTLFRRTKADDKKYRFAYFEEALDHPAIDPEIASAIKNTIKTD